MNKLKDIPVWENKRRLGLLKEFRKLIMIYYENSKPGRQSLHSREETSQAVEARHRINLKLQEVSRIITDTEVSFDYQLYFDQSSGITDGIKINLIKNVFDIGQQGQYKIPINRLMDVMDRAIGAYQSNQRKSLIRTWNPIWWLGLAIKWLVNLPFWLLDTAGFEGQKAADSIEGRIAKLVIGAIPIVASVLIILDLLGLLDKLKALWE